MKLKLYPQWQTDGGKVQIKVGIPFAKNEEALKCLPLEHIPKYFKQIKLLFVILLAHP